jgi:hypothetical protein
MSPSLRALLAGILDYAGIFPPAQLSLDQAIRNYALYRQEADAWMLGRFVCPTARLADLLPYKDELLQSGPPFMFVALGRGGNDIKELMAGHLQDFSEITAFLQTHTGRVVLDVLEFRLASNLLFINRLGLQHFISDWPSDQVTPFCEVLTGNDWRTPLRRAIAELSCTQVFEPSRLPLQPGRRCGFKLRCGGLHASSFPSPEQVAFTLIACRDAGVPLKFTAGLHHPLRHFDAGLQTWMHGFVNVFVAGVLARARLLSEEQILPILSDADASNFVFGETGLRWKDHHATTEEIVLARRDGVLSFGSCSFDEPREDLRALGWL